MNACRSIALRLFLCVAPVVLPILVSSARADVYTVSRHGSAIKPLSSTEVSMDAEAVDIEWSHRGHGYYCTAVFTMRNRSSKPVRAEVAFPVAGSSHPSFEDYQDVNREFKVEEKSGTAETTSFTPVSAVVRVAPVQAKDGGAVMDAKGPGAVPEQNENVVWTMSWAPQETKTLRIAYEMGLPYVVKGSNAAFRSEQLVYIVQTGALWKGPIGKADICFHFSPRGGVRPDQTSYPSHACWEGPKEKRTAVRWHFENWTPKEDIWVRWNTMMPCEKEFGYYYQLPRPYKGAQIQYTPTMLDGLVEEELCLAKQNAPELLAGFDRGRLRSLIAEWLYQELWARNGANFFVGRGAMIDGAPKGGYHRDNLGRWYAVWHVRFLNSIAPGETPWYQPREAEQGLLKLEDLSPQEQANARFLQQYLEPAAKP